MIATLDLLSKYVCVLSVCVCVHGHVHVFMQKAVS